MTILEFVKLANKERLANKKGGWVVLVEDVEGLAIVGASDLNGLMEQNPAFVLFPKTTCKLFLLNPHDHTAVCVQYGSSDFHRVIDETVYLPLTHPSEKVWTLGINHDERDPASAFD